MKEGFFESVLKLKILAAITLDSEKDALPIAEALLNGGLNVMEIPLRTSAAIGAITLIKKTFPEMKVGAGTILNRRQISEIVDAGADFGLSAGFNPDLFDEIFKAKLPYIPGVMSPSEIERAFALGFKVQKIFPIGQLGGTAYLKALQGPYGHLNLSFIPMGGIHQENVKSYISFGNVLAAGGSWMVKKEQLAKRDFKSIEEGIRELIAITSTN